MAAGIAASKSVENTVVSASAPGTSPTSPTHAATTLLNNRRSGDIAIASNYTAIPIRQTRRLFIASLSLIKNRLFRYLEQFAHMHTAELNKESLLRQHAVRFD
jgi:hypothetical protein